MNRTLVLLMGFSVIVACDGDDPTGLTLDDVAGSYAASQFLLITGTDTTDVLASGGHLTIALSSNGATAGSVMVPNGEEDGSDFFRNLDGTWELDERTVTFDHPADTFLRNMDFVYDEGILTGSRTGSLTIEVRLERD